MFQSTLVGPPAEPVMVSLSYSIRVNRPRPKDYPAANANQAVEKALTNELVKRFSAKERRLLLQIPRKPGEIIDSAGVLHSDLQKMLRSSFFEGRFITIPTPWGPILLPFGRLTYIIPGKLVQVLYMYIGPHEHRVIYIYGMKFEDTGAPVVIETTDTDPTKQFRGRLLVAVSWAQPIAELISGNIPERVLILEETAKIVLRQHGG